MAAPRDRFRGGTRHNQADRDGVPAAPAAEDAPGPDPDPERWAADRPVVRR